MATTEVKPLKFTEGEAVGAPSAFAVSAGDGTASSPVYSFSLDPNTGMYRIGNDVLGFSAGGAERMHISSAGISASTSLLPISTAAALDVGATDKHWRYMWAEQYLNPSASVPMTIATTTGDQNINFEPHGTGKVTVNKGFEVIGTTGYVKVPTLTTDQRNALTATNGMVIYNSDTGQQETYQSGSWVGYELVLPLTTKGDILSRNGSGYVRHGLGTDGHVLVANSAAESGLDWVAPLVNPMSAVGDLIRGDSGGAATRLAGNTTTTKNFLTQTGDGSDSAAPAWGTLAAADLPLATSSARGAISAEATGVFDLLHQSSTVNVTGRSSGDTASAAAHYTRLGNRVFVSIQDANITGYSHTPTSSSDQSITFRTTGLPGVDNATVFHGTAIIYGNTSTEYRLAWIFQSGGSNSHVVLVFNAFVTAAQTITIFGFNFSYIHS